MSRNYIPVINYSALLVNNFHKPLKVNFVLKVPTITNEETTNDNINMLFKYGKGSYISFDYEKYFGILCKRYRIIYDNPIKHDREYCWKDIVIKSFEGIKVSCENYLGIKNILLPKDSTSEDYNGLLLSYEYKIYNNEMKRGFTCVLNHEFTNNTVDTIKNFQFILHIPQGIKNKKTDKYILLYDLESIIIQQESKYYKCSRTDGYGNITDARSSELFVSKNIFEPGKKLKYSIIIRCIREIDKFEIFPMFLIKFISKRKIQWPEVLLKSDKKIMKFKRELFSMFNIALPSIFIFNVDKDSMKVTKYNRFKKT